MRPKVIPHLSDSRDIPTREQREIIRARSLPFLDSVGLDRPISFVLEEVYLQGFRDAVQAMEEV